jgi:flagellar hook-basal body complex protein FliE
MPTNLTLQPMPLTEGRRLREALQEPRITPPREGEAGPEQSFLETLEESIRQVNQLQQQADTAINDLLTGENKDVAQTMIAVQKASLSFQLMTQVRNKIVQAYEEVMRMPV